MYRVSVFLVLIINVFGDESRVVKLGDLGEVIGEKYWKGDFHEFYGIPYAQAPTGRDKFKPPLPVEPFESMDASVKNINCPQVYLTEDENEEKMLDGVEDCLKMNIMVPEVATEDNLVPVLVYIHSGAFSGGNGNMGLLHYLARHDVLVVSFNYRIGAIGFACLGTEDIPGNAGLRDQIAALKFIQKYIKYFGGDPDRVTLAGFSVGASMAELLTLSKAADGLFHQLILESGSALTPFAVNRHPVDTARNLARAIGFNGTDKIEELNEFLLNADLKDMAIQAKKFYLTNSTFGLAPCIESAVEGVEPVLTESPLITFQKGDYKQIPVLTGFANMEGISRTVKLLQWSKKMNDNFADFLPADLLFDSEKSRDDLIKDIKKHYFKNQEISYETIKEFVDYFSDTMFKYGIMKSAKLHAAKSEKPIYFYEFAYVGKLNMKHQYMEKLKGATHRDQTAYLIDFFDHTSNLKDMDTRDRMTTMWTNFVKYGNPTQYENLLIDSKWQPFTNEDPNYLEVTHKLRLKKDVFAKRFQFWDRVYGKYYWHPTSGENQTS